MKSNVSRRNWLRKISAGIAGLMVTEQAMGLTTVNQEKNTPFNPAKALANPKDPIKITRLEIIPIHTCRTIFIKMHTDAGVIGIGEGTVEGRIPTTITAIQELEKYLIGKDPRLVQHHWQAIYRHAFY